MPKLPGPVYHMQTLWFWYFKLDLQNWKVKAFHVF